MRLPMKPSHTPARTGVFFSFFASSNAVATTSGLTRAGTTISSSFITLAGEKKCRPITSDGRSMLAAIRSMSRYDVLVASTAPGLHARASSANTACLTAMSSNTASITTSACASASYDVLPLKRAIRAACAAGVIRPFATRPSYTFSTCARPRASDASSRSIIVTGSPASSAATAMPAPIVPPPTTPIRSTGRALARRASGAFAASRSAKNACTRPARCGLSTHCRNRLRSSFIPASNDSVSAASTASTIFAGENSPRDFFASSARAASIAARAAARSASPCASRVRRVLAPSDSSSCTYASPSASVSSLCARRSTRPSASASSALAWRPDSIRSSAAFAPISRGARCVPPAPGSRPSVTSGSPSFAPGTASR
ncbi:hypothetical protein WL46_00925 [Burkholderia ubonensis]|nr:hypothetical protein WL46_00925 [Burkholderia ubonensis]